MRFAAIAAATLLIAGAGISPGGRGIPLADLEFDRTIELPEWFGQGFLDADCDAFARTFCAVALTQRVIVLDGRTGAERWRRERPAATAVAVDPSGRWIVIGEQDGRIRFYSTTSWELISVAPPERSLQSPSPVSAICPSRTGRLVAVATEAGDLYVVEAPGGVLAALPARIAWSGPPRPGTMLQLAFGPRDDRVVFASSFGFRGTWDFAAAEPRIEPIPAPGTGPAWDAVAIEPGGFRIACAAGTLLEIHDLRSGGRTTSPDTLRPIRLLRYLAGGQLLAAAIEDELWLMDPRAGTRKRILRVENDRMGVPLAAAGFGRLYTLQPSRNQRPARILVWGAVRPDPSRPGFLGVRFPGRTQTNLPPGQITSVLPDTAAERAGLRAGDVILAVDGWEVTSTEALIDRLKGHGAGSRIRLRIRRGDAEMEIEVILGPRPPSAP
jgi:hypothetical protein